MTRSSLIQFDWAGEERTFQLKLKQLSLLQERCGNRGPRRILDDLLTGNWIWQDVVEPIRLGLTGGGMKLDEADKLIRSNVDGQALEEHVFYAVAIIQAVVVGPPVKEEKPGDDPPEGETSAATTVSTSPPSTDPGPQWDGAQAK